MLDKGVARIEAENEIVLYGIRRKRAPGHGIRVGIGVGGSEQECARL